MEAREERGLAIAATTKIQHTKDGYIVPAQSGNGTYTVKMDGCKPQCSCPDFGIRGGKCKHIYAVEYTMRREEKADGTTVVTKTVKVTYGQNWPVYNQAQVHEPERFAELLHDLCGGITMAPQKRRGRPSHPTSDIVFAATSKVYSTVSGRRASHDLDEWLRKGYLACKPSYNSIFDHLESPALTPILKGLIEESALPLSAVESDFAADSTGFATSVYSRWYDHKYGKERTRQVWVKTHIMCGVKTHIVTTAEATPFESNDGAQLPALVAQTAQGFNLREVSADKAYSTKRNLHVIESVGATPYVPFRAYSNGMSHGFDPLWNRMWHYYNFNRSAFLEHYHKRSNAETAFSMMKAKFGGNIRSKTPTAQVNEVLCKVLAHNLCCLIQSIYELNLEPVFWERKDSHEVAPVMALKATPW